MAVSLKWFVGLNHSKGRNLQVSRSHAGTPQISKARLTFSFGISPPDLRLSAAKTEQYALNSSDKGSTNSEDVVSDSPPSESGGSDVSCVSSQLATPESPNGTIPSPQAVSGQSPSTDSPSMPKRSPPLTARERLRAARVLSRYTNAKPSKAEMGSKVLDAIKQSEGGKRRSGLPEAPRNLFDDSRRGLPKEGFTFQFPGGNDLLIIGFSFVFISTVMFVTTYIVWKVGAIHFNEY